MLDPRTDIAPVNGDPGDIDLTKPASIPGIAGLLATNEATDKEPAISLESIALIKAITAKSVATEGEIATYMITLTRELPQISTSQLVELGVVAVKGFRVQRLIKATILSEAKMRFAGEGKAGRRQNGQTTWAGFCELIGEPRGTADTLVKALQVYKTMDPVLREAASQAGVDLLKPKVQQILRTKQEEMWTLQASDPTVIERWIAELQDAEGRSVATSGTGPEPGSCTDTTDRPSRWRRQQPTPEPRRERSNVPGPGGKAIAFTIVELTRYAEAIQAVRNVPGWAEHQIKEPEILLLALESFAADLEMKHANAHSRG